MCFALKLSNNEEFKKMKGSVIKNNELIVPPKGIEGTMIILKRYILKRQAKRAGLKKFPRELQNGR